MLFVADGGSAQYAVEKQLGRVYIKPHAVLRYTHWTRGWAEYNAPCVELDTYDDLATMLQSLCENSGRVHLIVGFGDEWDSDKYTTLDGKPLLRMKFGEDYND